MSFREKVNYYIFLSALVINLYSISFILLPLTFLKKIGLNTNKYIHMIFRDIGYFLGYFIPNFTPTKIKFYFNKDIPKEDFKNGFNDDAKSVIIVNHLNEIDPFFIGIFLDEFFDSSVRSSSFAKASIRWYPIIGWITMSIGNIFVKNHNKAQDKSQHVYIEKKIKDEAKLNSSYNFHIFPEGTTFRKDIHDYRNQLDKREGGKIPEFKNVMVPRTQGLWLIEKSVPLEKEYYLGIKYILPSNMKETEDGFLNLVLAKIPSEVHIFIDKKVPIINQLKDKDNRIEFDELVISRFKELDNVLENFPKWNDIYQIFLVNRLFFNKKMLRLLTISIFVLSLPFISLKFFTFYIISLVSFNIFLGLIEL